MASFTRGCGRWHGRTVLSLTKRLPHRVFLRADLNGWRSLQNEQTSLTVSLFQRQHLFPVFGKQGVMFRAHITRYPPDPLGVQFQGRKVIEENPEQVAGNECPTTVFGGSPQGAGRRFDDV